MRRMLILGAAIAALGGGGSALAAPNPSPTGPAGPGTGQPAQENPSSPGNCSTTSSQPPGIANSGGFAHATTVYANPGTTPSPSPHPVSEYDIACYQVSQPH